MENFDKIRFLEKSCAPKTGGFTLIEVLIAMAIFAIGILGVATMQISSTNGNTSARKSSEASEMGQGQIESLMVLSYADILALNAGNSVTADGYRVQWTITGQTDMDGDGDNDIMTVRVLVSDPQGRLRSSLTFNKAANI